MRGFQQQQQMVHMVQQPQMVQIQQQPIQVAAYAAQPQIQMAQPVVQMAQPGLVAPVQYSGNVAIVESPEPLNAPNPPMPNLALDGQNGQFHAQDELGQYSFGHYGGPNTRVETKDAFGRVSGSFAYVDPEGDVQVR